MPPKKKVKASARAPSSPVGDEDAMVIDTPPRASMVPPKKPPYDILKDPWTDEQETSLFKGIMKWKPNGKLLISCGKVNCLTVTGLHKHFRMIALSEYLRNHGYDPEKDQHTRIPGIWAKLGTMYNMEIIDSRENFEWDEEMPRNDKGKLKGKFEEFILPDDPDIQERMWDARLRKTASNAGSSPPRLGRPTTPPAPEEGRKKRKRGDNTTKTRASTVDDTDDAKTSPVNSPPAKATRSGRSMKKGRADAESRSRQPSKDTTVDEEMGEEDEEGDDEEADEDQEAEDDDETASPRASRTKSKAGPAVTRKSKRKRQ